MYSKNDIIEITIIDMSSDGEGIGKINGFPFFVKDAIIGDVIEAKVIKVKKNYAYARLMKIIMPSPHRVEPLCDIARPCGGCQIQELSYEQQLNYKQKKVFNNLVRIAGIDADYLDGIMEPILGMNEPFRYRNKAQYPIGYDQLGRITAGFYAGRTHSVIPCKDCMIGPKSHRKILSTITEWMEQNGIKPYLETEKTGLVRHVLIREGFKSGQIMVVLVVNANVDNIDAGAGKYQKLVKALNEIKGMTSIQLNENTRDTNVILGKKCKVLFGREYIEDVLCSLTFQISPLSFYQVNPLQTERLYGTALEFAALSGNEEVWDICCGIGTITLAIAREHEILRRASKQADSSEIRPKVHGLEIVPEAIENARVNARINNLEYVDFICAPAEEYMPANRNSIHADVIFTDPPRKGMDERSLEVMVSMKPKKIVYVSCDPATLARDVKYLVANGYSLNRVRPCDMFPHSVHVETVALLTRL